MRAELRRGILVGTWAEEIRCLRMRLRSKRSRWFAPSQKEFADRFGISAGAVRDAEQGRVSPSRAMRVMLVAIEMDPEFMEQAALVAMDRRRRESTDDPVPLHNLAHARERAR